MTAFRDGRYAEAALAFERAVALDPSNLNARLYLATGYLAQWIPGAVSPENAELARKAEESFRRVLEFQSNNPTALRSLASLAYNQKKLDEAVEWYQKVIAADPSDKEAYYSLGVIAWSKFYPELGRARQQLKMLPENPGPLPDFNLRGDLRNRFSAIVDDGIKNLQRSLELDPQYSDAMAYLNLLYRERADLRDTPEEYRADVAIADDWVARALQAKQAQGGNSSGQLPPPPPPPGRQPERIRVGGNVQKANLLNAPDPVYPALAMQARIQGTVRFTLTLAKDGTVLNVQLISGHPLLVPPAVDAVKQYIYRPTLLNGQPVEVITTVDVLFTLPN